MKNSKQAFVRSVIALVLCVSMFVGTTFAWFTDEVVSMNNIIQTGILDVELEWFDEDTGAWKDVDQSTNVFAENSLWEPGYTEVVYLRVRNAGNLALKYQLGVRVASQTQGINVNDEPFLLSDYIYMGVATENIGENSFYADRDAARAAITSSNSLTSGKTVNGEMLKDEADEYFALVVYMPESVGNEANYKVGTTQPTINLGITLLATQMTAENDSFGPDYDTNATFPVLKPGSVTVPVTPGADNRLTEDVAMVNEEGTISAVVPAGTLLNPGTTSLTFSVSELSATASNVVLKENEILRPMDVHIEGVAAGNTTPIQVTIKEAAMPGLNSGNYALYHVENGATNEMTDGALNAHNGFAYDPATGDVKLSMATFSEFALVADTENAWNGNFDYSWYMNAVAPIDGETVTEYIIANADQLAAFGAIVGGMNGQTKDSFDGKTVKLIADINLGDKDNANTSLIFHPIGYYYTDDKNADGTTGDYYSTVYSFKGTFDGNGHTIANFYQNTWEIKGDYDGNYYDVAMGLFGYVVNGTVKNLTVDNFSSDGEFTPTGVIAAYAVNSTFENIAITNCNPRVYNTGNGGIVGIGGNSDDPDTYKLTFNNITIDNTNIITALWGSWDVACGGLVGMFRGAGHVYMTNCHVAAQMDVYNDVCGNYQYYWYRYSGMLIGTNKNMTTDKDGYTVPETSKFHAEKCTVHFGNWNDYYYCELVANSLASYTHDHQFSRLEQIESLDEIKSGDTWTKTGNFLLISGDTKTCYHIVKNADGTLKQHNHADAGYEKDIDEDGDGNVDLKEDKQIVYLPFNQLFTGYGWGVKHIPIHKDTNLSETYPNLEVTILDREIANSVIKFKTKFTGDFLYRVGNKNAVSLGSLFELAADVPTALKNISSSSVWVTIEKFDDDMNVSGTYTKSTTTNWTDAKIQFSGTGVVKLTIQDYNFCKPTVLYLEVVDAKNVTTYGEMVSSSCVMLNNIEMTANGKYSLYDYQTLYGNGFTFNVAPGRDHDTAGGYVGGNGTVWVRNSILDNVIIVGEKYTTYGGTATSEYNFPTVLVLGDSVIANSYISNGCAAVRVGSGANIEIVNSTLEGGIFANLDIRGGKVKLKNVTTINQTNADGTSANSDGSVVGLGVVVYTGSTVTIDIDGLTQYNCISEKTNFNAPDATTLKTTIFRSYPQYHFTYQNVKWVNTGIVSMVAEVKEGNFSKINGYTGQEASIGGYNGYVYAPTGLTSVENPGSYKSQGQYAIAPDYEFDHTKNNKPQQEGTNESCVYDEANGEYSISFGEGESFVWNADILNVSKDGEKLSYTLSVTEGASVNSNNTVTFNKAGVYTVTYRYTDPYNYKADDKSIVAYEQVHEKTVKIVVRTVVQTTKKTEFAFGTNGFKTVTANGVTYVMPNVNATSGTKENGIRQTTIDGKVIYYPVIKMVKSGSSSWYNYFPVFDAVSITDLNETVHSKNSTSMPTGANGELTVIGGFILDANGNISTAEKENGTAIFNYATGKEIKCATYSNYGLCYYPDSKFTSSTNSRDEQTIVVKYRYTDSNNNIYYYYIGYWCEKHTKSCVTGDTLVDLADGTQKRIDEVTYNDQLLVWNFFTGKYDVVPSAVIFFHGDDLYRVLNLHFKDGTTVKVINNHGFFDMERNEFVFIDEDNVGEFIGHSFAKVDGDNRKEVQLVDYSITEEYTGCYSIQSAVHINFMTEGFFSQTIPPFDGWFDYFEIGEGMKYDEEKMQADIEKYGLYDYSEFADYVTYEQFVAFNGPYLKVLVGRGVVTLDQIFELIATYVNP